MHGLHKLPGFI